MPQDSVVIEGVADAPLLFDSLIARIKPHCDTFELKLLTDDVLRFRHVVGRDAFRRIRDAAHRFAESVTPVNAPEAYRPFVACDRDTLIWCHLLAALCLDEGGLLGFLQIQHYGPIVFDDLLEKFKTELVHVAEQVEMEEIDRAKKGSRSRSSGATGSKSRKTSGVSTPAN